MIGGDIIRARFLVFGLKGSLEQVSRMSNRSILLQPYIIKITENLEARRANGGIKRKQSSA
jgi:hypothetical protein